MTSKRHVLIINPQAQGGALGRRWPELAKSIRRQLGAFEEVRTKGPGDATELAIDALNSGADVVVAIGGDGTINEVVNGFFDDGEPINPEAAMGVLPFGSGGDFRKTIAVPKDLDQAAHRLAHGKAKRIDVGRIDYTTHDGDKATRMFINIASFGLSGLVDQFVNDSSKRLGGTLSFLAASARASLKYQNQRVRMTFDDSEPIDTIIKVCAGANGRYFGGGMYIAPEASLDDGVFDVVAVGDLSLFELATHSHRLYRGTHLTLDKVSQRRARRVHAEPLGVGDVLLDVDGESRGYLPATFTILPKSLAVIVA